jgi:DNA-binding SARP family transcriptional activator
VTAPGETRISLCGAFEAVVQGAAIAPPGRQGRVVFAHLVVNRGRAVGRDELLELLWPDRAPADPGETLSALLSRLRRAVGPDVLQGRRGLRLVLPEDADVDVERAARAAEAAEAALSAGEHGSALDSARAVRAAAGGGFMPGHELPWVEQRRRELEELGLRALEIEAAAGIASGPAELPAAERAARALVASSPFRESGHRLLMEALAARGDAAEALRAYDDLRVLLREELGTAPGPAVQELHTRLLAGELGPAERAGAPAAPATETPREERKLVTALCAELAPPGDPADPEDLRAALEEVELPMRARVERLGGSVQGSSPFIALFGAATAHEDDAERAILAALVACERGDVRRAAVASGEALVSGADRIATGQVVERARGLLGAARPGRVAVAPETAAAVSRAVELEADGEVALAVGLRARPARVEHGVPLVGRRRELAALEQLYGTAVDRQAPVVVTLTGHAGIGKTRLAEEFAARAGARGAVVYRGRCLPYGDRIALWALRELLCEAADIALDDPARTARGKLRAFAASVGIDDATTAALAVSAGIALDDAARDWTSPDDVAAEIALAWPALLTALARRAPLVLVVEDLHWAAPPLLEALERIAARSNGALMLLTTARPEFAEAHPGWSIRHGACALALEGLSRSDSLELVGELLPEAGERLRDRVVALAEGNPFFAEEIARHVGAGADPAESLPHGLRALLATRIDALPEAEKSALQHASVVGRRFWLSALEPNETGRPLADLFASLEERGLVVARPVSALPGEREFAFSHGLTREVAYRSIPRGARCRTHAAVANWIERLAGDRRQEFIYLLAYHYEAAASPRDARQAWPGSPDERERVRVAAVQTLLEAGSAAHQGLMSGDPVRLAERALALAREDGERLTALYMRARAHHAAVRGDQAFAAYLEALELAEATGDSDMAAAVRAHATLLCTRYMGSFADTDWIPAARGVVEEGLAELGEETESFEVGALLVGRSWGKARWYDVEQRDVPGARTDIERAVEIAERVGSNLLLTHALEGLTWLVLEEGDCEAKAMAERLLRSGRALSNRIEAHESIGVASICFTRAGCFDRARELAAETTRQAATLSPHRVLHAAAFETLVRAPCGEFEALLEATDGVVEVAHQEGGRLCGTGMVALAGRALALFERGRDDEVAQTLDTLRRLAPSARYARTYGHPTGELLRPVVGYEAAERWIAESDRRGDLGTEAQRLRAQLPVIAQLGDDAELEAAIELGRELAAAACAHGLRSIADLAEAALWARTGRHAQAVARAEAAAAALDRYGESYTGARGLAELVPLIDSNAAGALAQRAAARLTEMGAEASARLALGARVP